MQNFLSESQQDWPLQNGQRNGSDTQLLPPYSKKLHDKNTLYV
jgi:hypothetical protein